MNNILYRELVNFQINSPTEVNRENAILINEFIVQVINRQYTIQELTAHHLNLERFEFLKVIDSKLTENMIKVIRSFTTHLVNRLMLP